MIKLREDTILYQGDCLETMKDLDADFVDSIVTDPPYGLSFMNKNWDHSVPGVQFWVEALRVVKPGAYLLAFGGTRTSHRLACAIEDAGWEIRDTVMWVYGSGFPKSLNIGKAVDKAAGVEREVLRVRTDGRGASPQKLHNHGKGDTGIGHADGSRQRYNETAPATEAARQWEGFGTALKPSWEPIILARKPIEGTIANNVLKWGCGGLNIDRCRIGTEIHIISGGGGKGTGWGKKHEINEERQGRFPANFIHDGSDEVVGLFPITTGNGNRRVTKRERSKGWCNSSPGEGVYAIDNYGDSGSSARFFKSCSYNTEDFEDCKRFFYCAKASKKDRDEGNNHPTVKPTPLMQYLCRLVTPPHGTILDPFMGSGSTGKAALKEGFSFIGIELEEEYCKIAKARLENELRKKPMWA
jgi:DNA modification methylase